MAYYLTDIAELPYPHAMGDRTQPGHAQSTCPLALDRLIRTRGLDNADRHLARALLHADAPIKYYVNGHGQLELVGQHRVCWARTAGVAAVPVWFGPRTVRPPRGAVLLQRG